MICLFFCCAPFPFCFGAGVHLYLVGDGAGKELNYYAVGQKTQPRRDFFGNNNKGKKGKALLCQKGRTALYFFSFIGMSQTSFTKMMSCCCFVVLLKQVSK